MSNAAEPPTSDPVALQAMLAAERAENDRLRQIIRELQRHRFGRRAETLPVDQLLLGLEGAEQIEPMALPARKRLIRSSSPTGLGSVAPTVDRCPRICRVSSR